MSQSATFGDFATRVKEALQTTWGRDSFDFLINNGGSGVSASFAETTEEQFDEMVNVHFKGVFFLTQKLLPLLADLYFSELKRQAGVRSNSGVLSAS